MAAAVNGFTDEEGGADVGSRSDECASSGVDGVVHAEVELAAEEEKEVEEMVAAMQSSPTSSLRHSVGGSVGGLLSDTTASVAVERSAYLHR